MIISPGIFFIFSKFWFFGLLGVKKAKNSLKWQNILSVTLHIWRTIHHMTVCKMIMPSGIFFFLFFLIFWVHSEVKGQNMAQNDKTLCLLHFIFQEPYIMIYICGTGLDKLRAWWRVFTQHTCIMYAKILAGTKTGT